MAAPTKNNSEQKRHNKASGCGCGGKREQVVAKREQRRRPNENRRQPNENRGSSQTRTGGSQTRTEAAAKREQRRRPNKNRGGKTRAETRGKEAMAAMRREEEGAEAAKIQLKKT